MVISGNKREGIPVLKRGEETTIKLKKKPVTEKSFDEFWLQELLRETPDILPVEEIKEEYANLIFIGRNFPVDSKYIDNLYINDRGYITIVETKLWRNSEARREVVAQIIEYASKLSKWSFDDLDKKVKENTGSGIIETIINRGYEIDGNGIKLRDKINRRMSKGEFLLLIVGDGIKENVEDMVNYLSKTQHLHFKLALVELQVYDFPDQEKSYLIIPHVVIRTKEIERNIITIHIEGVSSDKVDIKVEEPPRSDDNKGKQILTDEDFFKNLANSVEKDIVDFAKQIRNDMNKLKRVSIEMKQANYVVKLPVPGGSKPQLSLFQVSQYGDILCGYLPGQLESANIPKNIAYDYLEQVGNLFNLPGRWSNPLKLKVIKEKYNDFKSIIERTINRINSLEPPVPPDPKELFFKHINNNSIKDVYEKWFNLWEKKNMKINWTMSGFSLQCKIQKKYKMIYHSWLGGGDVSLIKDKDLPNFGNVEQAYQIYVSKIKDMPENLKNNNCISHDSITPEQLELILQATTDFAEEVMDKDKICQEVITMSEHKEFSSRIGLIKGDITKLSVDAIVNAANEGLWAGSGVCGAIHSAAGSELEKECLTLGGCKTGNAKITKGYKLPAKWVIHAVGPIWHDGNSGEDELLAGCYRNSLVLAEKHNIKTIAFPSISTGIYRFPIERAVKIAIREVKKFLAENTSIEKVIFVCFSENDYSYYNEELNNN